VIHWTEFEQRGSSDLWKVHDAAAVTISLSDETKHVLKVNAMNFERPGFALHTRTA
jgi:hypothetical protein